MKAAFVGSDPAQFARVYAGKQLDELKSRVELLPGLYEDVHDPALSEVEAIFSTWSMLSVSEEEIKTCLPKLKYVFYAAGSVQRFVRPFLNCGVRVFSAWQANAVAVAQYTFAQIELALKGYFPTQALISKSRAEARAMFEHYSGSYEVRVGLLGCGAIGSMVAELLKMLDVEVLAYDPFLSDERAQQLGVRKTDMDEIFAKCEVVSNHLANLPATVGIIKRHHLLSMLPYATFINTGRGAQLVEQDLYDMLTQDPTRCALLDVLIDELHTDDNPLRKLPNCFITPHIAGANGLEVRRMARYMLNAFDQVQAGEPSSCEVLAHMLENMA